MANDPKHPGETIAKANHNQRWRQLGDHPQIRAGIPSDVIELLPDQFRRMRLHVLSDLHMEFSAFKLPMTDADVVVLAGDVDIGTDELAALGYRIGQGYTAAG